MVEQPFATLTSGEMEGRRFDSCTSHMDDTDDEEEMDDELEHPPYVEDEDGF